MKFQAVRNKIALVDIGRDDDQNLIGTIHSKGATVIDQFKVGDRVMYYDNDSAGFSVDGTLVVVVDDSDVLGIVSESESA